MWLKKKKIPLQKQHRLTQVRQAFSWVFIPGLHCFVAPPLSFYLCFFCLHLLLSLWFGSLASNSMCCSWQLVFPLINPPVIIAWHTGPREACSDAITSCRASHRTISTSKRLRGPLLPTRELTGWAKANGMCPSWHAGDEPLISWMARERGKRLDLCVLDHRRGRFLLQCYFNIHTCNSFHPLESI